MNILYTGAKDVYQRSLQLQEENDCTEVYAV